MALLSTLYPRVLPYVPGCPDPMLDQEINLAAAEFLRDSRAWVEWLDAITVSGSTREYDLDLPTGSAVVDLYRATCNGSPIGILSFLSQEKNPATSENASLGIVTGDKVTITLTRSLAAGSRLEIQAALMPSPAAQTLPDAILAQHADAISSLARYRLMRVPGALHNPEGAARAFGEYQGHLGKATIRAFRGNAPSVPRANPKWC